MSRSPKSILLSISLLFFAIIPARASHLAGSDLIYALVDSNGGTYHYRVTLIIYQDCLNGLPEGNAEDNPAHIYVYTGAGKIVDTSSIFLQPSLSTYSIPVTANGICDSGGTAVALCRNKLTFLKDYHLKASTTGYFITYQRCCLNYPINLVSPAVQGMGCFITIPPSGTATHNNSAVFTNYPPLVIGKNIPLAFDCSATDADGDSLSYELCPAYMGGSEANAVPIPALPPYTSVNYTAPLTFSQPMYCSVPLAIDPVTGSLTGTPDSTGLYLIDVSCKEWRKGVLINTVQREFEFTVADCKAPPVLTTEIMALYPNPTTADLNIFSTPEIKTIVITNILGQKFTPPILFTSVLGSADNLHSAIIRTFSLAPGIYLLNLNGSAVKKFVKE